MVGAFATVVVAYGGCLPRNAGKHFCTALDAVAHVTVAVLLQELLP